jgi:hypothetical protein
MIKKRPLVFFSFFISLMFLVTAFPLWTADLAVPVLDLLTEGRWDADAESVVLQTSGEARIELSGGFKFGGNIAVGFFSNNLGYSDLSASDVVDSSATEVENIDNLATYLDNNTYLQFIGTEIVYRELFGRPDNTLSWFIGRSDTFASGEIFTRYFGTEPIATRYRGKRYFDSGFDGIHTVNGTGIGFGTGWGSSWNHTRFFLYQDGYMGDGIYSFDAASAFNLDTIKLESFIGATFPAANAGIYRAGFLFHYNPGIGGEFLAQIGVPRWEAPEPFSIGDFFFLFEPRIDLDPLKVILTLFWQPNYYLQTERNEGESANIHINFLLGDSPASTLSGGLETSFVVNTDWADPVSGKDQFEIRTSPYISLATPGVSWNFALDINLLPFDLGRMVVGIVNVKAVF